MFRLHVVRTLRVASRFDLGRGRLQTLALVGLVAAVSVMASAALAADGGTLGSDGPLNPDTIAVPDRRPLVPDGLTAPEQRPPTVNPVDVYGRRFSLPLPDAPAGAHVRLVAANGGWVETTLAVAVFRDQAVPECPAPASEAVKVLCGETLPAFGQIEVDLDVNAASHVLAYALDANDPEACQALETAAANGGLASWETRDWTPGQPLSVVARLASDDGSTSVTGNVAIAAFLPPRFQRTTSLGFPGAMPGDAQLVNGSRECVSVQVDYRDEPPAECAAAQQQTLSLAAFGAGRAEVGPGGVAGLVATSAGDLHGVASGRTAQGWWSYSARHTAAVRDQLTFPFAMGLADDLQNELVVGSHAVTATTTVELTITDGAGQLVKVYTDSEPLCPRAFRSYDLNSIVGPLPDNPRRGPHISVEASSLAGTLAPISGAVILSSDVLGTAAYPGLGDENVLAELGRMTDASGRPIHVVADLRHNASDSGSDNADEPPDTSVLVLNSLRGRGNSAVTIDFYSADGTKVLEGAYVNVRSSSSQVLLLSRPFRSLGGEELRLPQGFHGSAVLTSNNPRVPLSVMVLSDARPVRGGTAIHDAMDLHFGHFLLQPPDPNAPTPTATQTPRPTSDVTATPTEPEPTATDGTVSGGTGSGGTVIFLPIAEHGPPLE